MSTTPGLKDALQWVQGSNPGFDTSAFLRNPYNSAAVGGVAGAGLGGVISGGLAASHKKKNESKENRRRRIMRQALLGAGLGGTAGASVGPLTNIATGVKSPDNKLEKSLADLVGSTEAATGKKQPGFFGNAADSALRGLTFRGGRGDDHNDWDHWAAGLGGAAGVGGTYAATRNMGRGNIAKNVRTNIFDLQKGLKTNGALPVEPYHKTVHDELGNILKGTDTDLRVNKPHKALNNAITGLSNSGSAMMSGSDAGKYTDALLDSISTTEGVSRSDPKALKKLRRTLIDVFGIKPSQVDAVLHQKRMLPGVSSKALNSPLRKGLSAARGALGRRFFRSRWRAPASKVTPMAGLGGLAMQTAGYGAAATAPAMGLDAFRHFKPYEPGPDMNAFVKDVKALSASGLSLRDIESKMREKGYPDEWVAEAQDISNYSAQ